MSGRQTILIVDDDPQILRLVERMLGARKATILLAPRPSAALEICRTQSIDVLISDVAMPEMDGDKLAERVLKLQPGVSVLLISGHYREPPAAVKNGQIRFLKKPFYPAQLIEHLRLMLPDEL
jgi:two-component system, cell cycle sensor histidine kinase and response regulator CckA